MNNKNKELQELVNEILITKNNYIKNSIPLVEKLGKDFYEEPSKQDWDQLTDLFDGIGWIVETLMEIDSIKNLKETIKEYEIWNEYVQTVSELYLIIPKLEKALETKDNTTTGDILSYEVVPTFKDMTIKLEGLNLISMDVNIN